MAKTSGLGDRFYAGAYDLSGDTQTIKGIESPLSVIDVTDITQSGYERLPGLRDAKISWSAYFDGAAGAAHEALSALPRTNVIVTYLRGAAIGATTASLVAKQLNYDGSRGSAGDLLFSIDAQSNGRPLYWGTALTAGARTDTEATGGASYDATTVSTSFGWALTVHLLALTGTDVTVTVEDSANNVDFTPIANATSGALTARGAVAVRSATTTATVRRYLRAVTTTTGGFTSATFVVAFTRGEGSAIVL